MRKIICVFLLLAASAMVAPRVSAAEPGWSPVIVATGSYRRKIQSTPIEHRPYRPLHFYGNTIRRMHHRGNPLPLPSALASPRLIRSFRVFN